MRWLQLTGLVVAGCAGRAPAPVLANSRAAAPRAECDPTRLASLVRTHEFDAATLQCVPGNFRRPGWYLDSRKREENFETWIFGVVDLDGKVLVPVHKLTVISDALHDNGRWEIESMSAVDLDGDGVDEILEVSRTRPQDPADRPERTVLVYQIVDGAIVRSQGESLAYRSVNVLSRAVTECASTFRLERAGDATHLVIDTTVASGPRAHTCLAVGRHVFTARGGKLVELAP